MSSQKYSRGIRFAELLMRQEAIVRRHIPGWAPLEFESRRVVEVGCGPLAGFGPLAIFCGATMFESAEPEWDEALFHSEPIRERYLRTFHADLVGLYGERMRFADFTAALKERMRITCGGFQTAPIVGPVDVVLSQSVLEHVFPLSETVAKLAEIQTPATRFLHLVDFGNHYPTSSPFEGLYDVTPDEYIARRGKAINCLRAPDVAATFEKVGIAVRLIPSRRAQDGYRGAIHPSWRSRYDDDALFTQLALVASPA